VTTTKAISVCCDPANEHGVQLEVAVAMINTSLVVLEGNALLIEAAQNTIVFVSRGWHEPECFVVVRRDPQAMGTVLCDVLRCKDAERVRAHPSF